MRGSAAWLLSKSSMARDRNSESVSGSSSKALSSVMDSFALSHFCNVSTTEASSPARFAVFASNESARREVRLVCSSANDRARESKAGDNPTSGSKRKRKYQLQLPNQRKKKDQEPEHTCAHSPPLQIQPRQIQIYPSRLLETSCACPWDAEHALLRNK